VFTIGSLRAARSQDGIATRDFLKSDDFDVERLENVVKMRLRLDRLATGEHVAGRTLSTANVDVRNMTVLLNIQSSPNLASSGSRAASKVFLEKYLANHPGTTVVDLDLVANPPPHVGVHHLGAYFGPPEAHTPENKAALDASDAYVDQLLAADIVLIGTPMHNLSIASVLKSWIDNVVRAGRTFRYTETGAVGLVPGKKVVIIVGSGGVYSYGPMQDYEHAANYLKAILGVMGITDITVVRAEGLALGPEMAAKGSAAAAAAAEVAAS
jgi:FMN-dependent NADH-azoreductase